jgi:hypothetical protein
VDLTGARWRKSSFSGDGNQGAGCVEVAFLTSDTVAVRDSKNPSLAPHVYPAAEWSAFLAGIRAGEFDHPSAG